MLSHTNQLLLVMILDTGDAPAAPDVESYFTFPVDDPVSDNTSDNGVRLFNISVTSSLAWTLDFGLGL